MFNGMPLNGFLNLPALKIVFVCKILCCSTAPRRTFGLFPVSALDLSNKLPKFPLCKDRLSSSPPRQHRARVRRCAYSAAHTDNNARVTPGGHASPAPWLSTRACSGKGPGLGVFLLGNGNSWRHGREKGVGHWAVPTAEALNAG